MGGCILLSYLLFLFSFLRFCFFELEREAIYFFYLEVERNAISFYFFCWRERGGCIVLGTERIVLVRGMGRLDLVGQLISFGCFGRILVEGGGWDS